MIAQSGGEFGVFGGIEAALEDFDQGAGVVADPCG